MTQAGTGPMAAGRESSQRAILATAAAMIAMTFSPSTIAMMGVGVFIRAIQTDLGIGRGQVILISTVVNFTVVFCSPLYGILLDRLGVRRVILPSLVLFAGGLASFTLLPARIDAIYIAWAIVIAASSGLLPAGYLRLVSTWFDKRLGLAIGIANSGFGIGNIVVPLIAGAVIARFDWQTAYLSLAGIVLLVVWPICYLFLRENDAAAVASQEVLADKKARSAAAFKTAATQRTFWILVVTFLLLGMGTAPIAAQQVPLLIDRGLSLQDAASVQSVFGVFMLIGRVAAGYLLDRMFLAKLMILCLIGAIAACLMYILPFPIALAYLPAALVGLVIGSELDVLGYAVKKYFGLAAFARIYATVFSMFQLGAGLGAVAYAVTHDYSGGYRLGLSFSIACQVVTAALFLFLPRYPGQPATPEAATPEPAPPAADLKRLQLG